MSLTIDLDGLSEQEKEDLRESMGIEPKEENIRDVVDFGGSGGGGSGGGSGEGLVTPHTHTQIIQGGVLDEYALDLSDLTVANASSSKHGFIKKLSGAATDFFNGAGNWVAGTAIVAGSDTQVQFNDGGALGADSNFTYNKSTGVLQVNKNNIGATGRLLVLSTNANQAVGLSLKVDATELWQVATDNAESNDFFIQQGLSASNRFLKMGSGGDIAIGTGAQAPSTSIRFSTTIPDNKSFTTLYQANRINLGSQAIPNTSRMEGLRFDGTLTGSDVTTSHYIYGLYFDLTNATTAGGDASDSTRVRGLIGQVTTSGPGSVRGIHATAYATDDATATGFINAGNFQVIPGANTPVGLARAIDVSVSATTGIAKGITFATSGGASFLYGIDFATFGVFSTSAMVLKTGATDSKILWNNGAFISNPSGTIIELSGTLQLDGSTSGSVTIKSPAAPTSYTLTFPTSAGSAGQAFVTDGAGVGSWSATINSTAIPASKTLVVTTDKLSVLAATTSAELAGVISDEVGSGALVFGTGPTLSDVTVGSGRFRGVVSANPGSLVTGDWWIRSDLGGWGVYYDGTRSLTTHEDSISWGGLGATSYTVNGGSDRIQIRTDYAPYFIRAKTITLVITTNDATNYWTMGLRGINSAHSATTTVYSTNTSGDTVGVYTAHEGTPGTQNPANCSSFDVTWSKTNAPGALSWSGTFYYRLIIT